MPPSPRGQHVILRSLLFVPGNKASMLEKALGLEPDALVPDMEDSVPAAETVNARETIRSWLPRLAASGIPILPRVNALDTEWIEPDLEAIVGARVLGISVGKVRKAARLGGTARELAARRASASKAGSRSIPSRSTLNDCFSPSAQEVAHAERVVAAFEEAERLGRGSTSFDGWVIDVPVVKRARALLELARRTRAER